jgi:transformation/transcription domain-associated protein
VNAVSSASLTLVDWDIQFGLEQQLCLFARDEVMTWLHGRGQPWTFDISFRTNCASNIENVVKRAEVMACKLERDQVSGIPLA